MSLQELSIHETALQLGLTKEEADEIISRLGRTPTLTELSMLSVEWSEHCSYRRSRKFFSGFPRTGPVPVLVGEDAGGIILEDLAIVFKVESHNHPSQVEPKHGAATGVGGIIRDILSVGARPVALLNSLRFGPLNDPANQRLFRGVVDGIQWYGNSIGIPTVGGEIDFHPAYAGNCLVNVMCVGVAGKEALLSSKAKAGNAVMILGSRTGRDGIGGCSVLASQEMREALSKRPTVQVGDPYFGKCLIEATLEAASLHLFVAVKDMGAAGLTCTTSEMSAAGKCGMEVDVSKIPAREESMEPWEFMMSESQERMLAVVKPDDAQKVRKIFHAWGLEAEVIGKTIPQPEVKIYSKEELIASLSTQLLVEPPPLSPHHQAAKVKTSEIKLPQISDMKKTLLEFWAHPSLVSKKWAWRQYDSMVQTNTVLGPGSDAALLRIAGKAWGIAVVLEGNGRYCKINPALGAEYIVAEAARNLVAVGAKPLAVTDGLNFGNPDKPEAYGEFVQVMEGLARACQALNLPVVSGNVSFFNEGETGRILPTPIIGMIGMVPDIQQITPMAFQNEHDSVFSSKPLVTHSLANCSQADSLSHSFHDKIYLVGEQTSELSGSLFAEYLGLESSFLPPLDWGKTKQIHEAVLELHSKALLASCHDLSQGGLLAALAECAVYSGIGAGIQEQSLGNLLNEAPSRFLITIAPNREKEFQHLLNEKKISFRFLGEVGGTSLSLEGIADFSVEEINRIFQETLPALMGEKE